ncbi:MAG: hypothetical protein JNL12_13745 [Planctomycetes bacterium]|nr:hypothetical protein [Planctomycetota bacterium]
MRPILCTLALLFAAVPSLAQTPAKAKVEFQRQVLPIFEKHCLECHATPHTGSDGKLTKPKGGVVLDSKDGITTSKRGRLVVAGKPDSSMLFDSISLPADDDDRMPPPKKGAPLTQEQQDLIKRWIEEGAAFGSWTGQKAEEPASDKAADKPSAADKPTGKPSDKPADKAKPKESPIARLQKGLPPLTPSQLEPLVNSPFQLASLGDDSPLLRVGCAGRTDEVDDKAMQLLLPIASHIAELDLSRSGVGDGACTVIAAMPRLLKLDLRQTQVGDAGVAKLVACKELRTVNLFGTKIGDYALAALGTLKQLENVYVWQTEASAGAVMRLREQVPGVRVVFAVDLPEPMGEGQGQGAGRRRQQQKK